MTLASELERLVAGEHPDPHARARRARGRRRRSSCARSGPGRTSVRVLPQRGEPVELRAEPPGGRVRGACCRAGARCRATASRSATRTRRRSSCAIAYSFAPALGRARPAPHRRGPARAALGRARRAPARRSTARPGRRSRCGRRTRARGQRRRRLQRLGRRAPSRCARSARPASGSCSCPRLRAGAAYKFEIRGADGDAAPQGRPARAARRAAARAPARSSSSSAHALARRGLAGAARRAAEPHAAPMSIYEVHLGSWRLNPLEGNRSLTYASSPTSSPTTRSSLGFTHVELMPVMEHPFTGSWGYQVTGYYAPTARYGTPDDFRSFVDRLHARGIGVILDWVPAHFPRDEFALARFDGTALYEHDDPRRGEHPDWGTLDLQLRPHRGAQLPASPTRSSGSTQYHVDGLRVDAVASMLYLDYSPQGGRVDAEPVRRPREPRGDRASCEQLNEVVHGREPGRDRWPRRSRPPGRGVSRPTYARRPRLRLQVEHGLDARHAARTSSAIPCTAATTTTSSRSA